MYNHRRTTGGGKGGSSPPWASQGGEVPPPEDLVQSRHREISATFEIRKKSYWPYLRVLHPVDAIYIHSPSISINIGVQLGGGKGGSSPGWASQGGKFPPLKIWSKVGTAKFPQHLKLEKNRTGLICAFCAKWMKYIGCLKSPVPLKNSI